MISSLRRPAAVVPLALLAGLLAVVGWYFQPWTAFFDDVVHESPPTATSGVRVLATGEFTGSAHPTRGTVTLYELSDGSQLLRLEDLVTPNGPRLRVALADVPNADGTPAGHVDLGAIKGNIGEANYPLPVSAGYAAAFPTAFPTVVIWSVWGPVHGTASLTPVMLTDP